MRPIGARSMLQSNVPLKPYQNINMRYMAYKTPISRQEKVLEDLKCKIFLEKHKRSVPTGPKLLSPINVSKFERNSRLKIHNNSIDRSGKIIQMHESSVENDNSTVGGTSRRNLSLKDER